jgi:hypothetical protein
VEDEVETGYHLYWEVDKLHVHIFAEPAEMVGVYVEADLGCGVGLVNLDISEFGEVYLF